MAKCCKLSVAYSSFIFCIIDKSLKSPAHVDHPHTLSNQLLFFISIFIFFMFLQVLRKSLVPPWQECVSGIRLSNSSSSLSQSRFDLLIKIIIIMLIWNTVQSSSPVCLTTWPWHAKLKWKWLPAKIQSIEYRLLTNSVTVFLPEFFCFKEKLTQMRFEPVIAKYIVQ